MITMLKLSKTEWIVVEFYKKFNPKGMSGIIGRLLVMRQDLK